MELNYQMFADVNTQTTGGLSAEMKTYYGMELLENAKPQLVHNQFAATKPLPVGGGKTVEWRKFGAFDKALTPLTEGVTPDGSGISVSYITKELAQYGDYTTVSDMLDLTAIDDVVLEITDRHGNNMGLTLDTVTRNEIQQGNQVIYAPVLGEGGKQTAVTSRVALTPACRMTSELVAKAATQLKKMNAPTFDGKYVCIIHPSVAFDLRQDEAWIAAHQYAAATELFSGEIGELHGVRFVETTEAKVIGPGEIVEGVCRMKLRTALNSTGSTTIAVEEEITSAQAAALSARISGGETVKIYVGGKEATLTGATAGDAGAASLTVSAAVKDVSQGAVVCGAGAGKDGSAIYLTLVLGAGAYGVTTITGGGLEHIVKALGSGGTSDPLNQRATCGWKATKTAERLVEQYMVRIEHGSPTFSHEAVSN